MISDWLLYMVGRAGFEPATNWLKAAFCALFLKGFLFSIQEVSCSTLLCRYAVICLFLSA
jgi:hypothetical protein